MFHTIPSHDKISSELEFIEYPNTKIIPLINQMNQRKRTTLFTAL